MKKTCAWFSFLFFFNGRRLKYLKSGTYHQITLLYTRNERKWAWYCRSTTVQWKKIQKTSEELPELAISILLMQGEETWVSDVFTCSGMWMKDQTESGDGWEGVGGREVQERGDVFIRIADSLCCSAETNTTMWSNYTSLIKKKETQMPIWEMSGLDK